MNAERIEVRAELFEDGHWRGCSGCHELDEGHATGPWSDVFRCNVGSGCRECGGIGAVWEAFDFDTSDVEPERPPTVSDETINQAIQDLFDKHKADGTVTALIAALIDVQAMVLVTISHEGAAAVEHATDKGATSATIATVLDISATAAATLGAA